jgi:hypothetical protein
MTDDFSDHPQSLSEVKAHREGKASLWTPRDALIDTLRMIDKGEIDPTGLVISYELTESPGAVACFIAVSGRDRHHALGILAASMNLLVNRE